jgi:hypothetical protein
MADDKDESLPESPLSGFVKFVKEARSLGKWPGVTGAASQVPVLLAGWGAPWPDNTRVGIVTGVFELAVFIFVYRFYRKASLLDGGREFLDKRLQHGLGFLCLMLLTYIVLFNQFVIEFSDRKHSTDAKGIWYTEQAKQSRAQDPGVSDLELAMREGGDIKAVYTSGSVDFMRLVLLGAWIGLYCAITYVLTVFVVLELREATGPKMEKTT